MPPRDHQTLIKWLDFEKEGPPGLNTERDPAEMGAGFSPDAYGINLDTENRLSKGTIPTGDTRVSKDITVNSQGYQWFYSRLWRFSGNSLIFGAPYYDDAYYKQGIGNILFDEDANPIVEFLPFGQDSMAIGKLSGSYVLSNLNDTRGEAFWRRSDLIQEVRLTAIEHCTELDGVAYFSTATGLYAFSGRGEVTELTRNVRNTLGNFSNVDLKSQYLKKRVIGNDGTSKFVYDAERNKLYDYTTTGFRYVSPDLHQGDYAPFQPTRLHFAIQNASSPLADQSFDIQIKGEENDWSDEETVSVDDVEGQYSIVTVDVEQHIGTVKVRRLRFRLTDMSTNLRIRAVYVDNAVGGFNHYSE